MKTKKHKVPIKKITATKMVSAPSNITPMNSTAPFAISAFCAAFAPIAYTSQISASLRSLWSRLVRLLSEMPFGNLRTSPFRVQKLRRKLNWELQLFVWRDRIAWLRKYSLNIALLITVVALAILLIYITWLHLILPGGE
jgi:hypothetical protein